jgi:hypothetical protein
VSSRSERVCGWRRRRTYLLAKKPAPYGAGWPEVAYEASTIFVYVFRPSASKLRLNLPVSAIRHKLRGMV